MEFRVNLLIFTIVIASVFSSVTVLADEVDLDASKGKAQSSLNIKLGGDTLESDKLEALAFEKMTSKQIETYLLTKATSKTQFTAIAVL